MKNFLTLILGLVLSINAFAYSSGTSGDPAQGFRDFETKTVVKSATDGYSAAISKGHALFYEDGSGIPTGLYTVSREYSGTYNTALATRSAEACIAAKDVATGDTAGFPCVVRGYVDYAIYSAVTLYAPIAVGDYLCISDQDTVKGYLVKCGSGVTSKFVALEAKSTTGTGTIKVKINE